MVEAYFNGWEGPIPGPQDYRGGPEKKQQKGLFHRVAVVVYGLWGAYSIETIRIEPKWEVTFCVKTVGFHCKNGGGLIHWGTLLPCNLYFLSLLDAAVHKWRDFTRRRQNLTKKTFLRLLDLFFPNMSLSRGGAI